MTGDIRTNVVLFVLGAGLITNGFKTDVNNAG
jgi:hypothetical protein